MLCISVKNIKDNLLTTYTCSQMYIKNRTKYYLMDNLCFQWKEVLNIVKVFCYLEDSWWLCRKGIIMRIITFATLREYSKKHADTDVPLRDWYKKTEKSDCSCLADIKKTSF